MNTLSIVIPALNEASNLPTVMGSVPVAELAAAGWDTEVVVVDNASTDDTATVARELGARVVTQLERGYGNAYQAGFEAATGDVIATGDADCTYPFDALPDLLRTLVEQDVEFMTTDRLRRENRAAMKPSHFVANHALSTLSRTLFRNGLRDSQSGMWIFRSYIWHGLDVRSGGMAFSQEIKNAVSLAGYRFTEVPIEYRTRGGEVKLNALPDGMANLRQLFAHRFRKPAASATGAASDGAAALPVETAPAEPVPAGGVSLPKQTTRAKRYETA
ncbi:glycosyltransferase family 2 protein [Kitasatospora sp. NBC_00374]|uniref:glycosyltransferase family 2 protein n=1 Tax=Kitasatospora sp. NBC_00374 TaxID=2975964 RepID=UPI003247D0A7